MKKSNLAALLLSASAGLLAPIAGAATDQVTWSSALQNPQMKQAFFTTQLIAAAICHEQANLNPQALYESSGVFAFLAVIYSVDPGTVILSDDHGLARSLNGAYCDAHGVIQMLPKA